MKRTVWMTAAIAAISWAACATTPAGGGDDDDDDGGPTCGNSKCEDGETKQSCPDDCGSTNDTGTCGDNKCDAKETLDNCPADCAVCGDNICSSNEDLSSCPADCAVCGDSVCSSTESGSSCPQDCDSTMVASNQSSFTITGLYVYACGATNRGQNQIAGRVIVPNNMFTLTQIPPGCYNFHADGSGGVFWDRFNTVLEAAKSFTWTLIN